MGSPSTPTELKNEEDFNFTHHPWPDVEQRRSFGWLTFAYLADRPGRTWARACAGMNMKSVFDQIGTLTSDVAELLEIRG